MRQAEFEKQLTQKIRKRRWIEGGLTLGFLAISIIFLCVREATKEVIVHEGTWFIPDWEEVNYNENYLTLSLLGVIGVIWAGAFLFADFLACEFKTIQKDLQHITVWRGMLHTAVYVDGMEKGRTEPFDTANVVEFRLASNVKVTVSFSRSIWSMAHISFSDDTASVEV